MSKKTKRISMVVFVGALLVALVSWYRWTPAQNRDKALTDVAQQTASIVLKERRFGNGKFVLRGVVVDDTGQPLDHVEVKILKQKSVSHSIPPEDEREVKTVSGEFHLTFTGYNRIDITFRKSNYRGFSSECFFNTFLDGAVHGDSKEWGSGGKIDGLFEKKDIKVVLKKEIPKVNLMSLLLFGFNVPVLDQAKPMAIQISTPTSGPEELALAMNRPSDKKFKMSDIIHLWTDVDENRQAKAVQASENPKMADLGLPQALHLKSLDPNGGFIRCHYPTQTFYFKDMVTAPETGYEREVVLTSSDWNDLYLVNPERKGVFLYVKIGSRYGKMRMDYLKVRQGELDISGELYIQSEEENDRNLYSVLNEHE